MEFKDRWEVVKDLGEGGQGKVYLVRDRQTFSMDKICVTVIDSIREMGLSAFADGQREKAFSRFHTAVKQLIHADDTENLAALKVLHPTEKARDPERAEERIRREMQAMSTVTHPNLLRIVQADPNCRWYASEYHPNGALLDKLSLFQGDFPRALRAFREIVAAVAELHANKIVHRDIKPHKHLYRLGWQIDSG